MEKFGTGAAQSVWGWVNSLEQYLSFGSNEINPIVWVWWIIRAIVVLIGGIIGGIITIVLGIIDTVVEFFKWVGGLFNDTDDDNARDVINRSSCEALRRLSTDRVVEMVNSMLDGFTGNDDERSMLKLFRCLPCDRFEHIVDKFGRSNIEDDFHGSEYDQLRVLMGNCGIISFSSWDDDATRLFIANSECEALRELTVENIMALISNLFAGRTRNNDERAIIRLLGCQFPETVRELVSRPGFSKRDFDRHVDGSEWDLLSQVFRDKEA